MAHFGKGRTLVVTYSKLLDMKLGPFRVLHKVGYNACILDLHDDPKLSSTFNISDLYEYYPPGEGTTLLTD